MSAKNLIIVDRPGYLKSYVDSYLKSEKTLNVVSALNNVEALTNILQRKHPEHISVDIILLVCDSVDCPEISSILDLLKKTDAVLFVSTKSSELSTKIGFKAIENGAKDFVVIPPLSALAKGAEFDIFHQNFLKKISRHFKKIEQNISASNKSKSKAADDKPNTPLQILKPTSPLSIKKIPPGFLPQIITVSSSTGGPQILTKIFCSLSNKRINMPILVTQHMPKDFTGLLAEQIRTQSSINCVEAQDGMQIERGTIYIAPGDYHMLATGTPPNTKIKLSSAPPENFCRPAADPMLRSVVEAYGGNKILSIVLTGMGKDGCDGSILVSQKGGVVIAQDYDSSAVWGMPGAVANAGICSFILPPEKIVEQIIELSAGKIL